jgi:hypothetical protein
MTKILRGQPSMKHQGALADRSSARRARNYSITTIRALVGGLAIICAAALVACSGPPHTTGTSATSTKSGPSPAQDAELPSSQIPWNKVGPGWTLATWTLTPNPVYTPKPGHQYPTDPPPPPPPNLPVTLYLFDPAGARYLITTLAPWPADRPGIPGHTPVLADWSGDGRHALFEDNFPAKGHATMTDVDLATGAKQTVEIDTPGYTGYGTYSGPTGHAILLSGTKTNNPADPSSGEYTQVLERFDLSGTKQLTFPTDHLGAAGKFNLNYLQTPDGSQLVLGTDNGMVVVNNDGSLDRQLPVPSAPRTSCKPVRWWTSTVILAGCNGPPGKSMTMQLWQVPLAGGTPTALTPVDEHNGYLNGWQIPSGTFLENQPGCGGDGELFRLTTDTHAELVRVPGLNPNQAVRIIGVIGDKLLLKTTGGCGSHSMVLRIYDPAANTATILSGPPGDGGVKRAILYPNP